MMPRCRDLPEAAGAHPRSSSPGHLPGGPPDHSPCAWSQAHDASLRQVSGRAAPGSTVALPAAACALGMSYDEAAGLAVRGAFPCSIVESGAGYRVPVAALMAILGGRPQRPRT